MISHRGISVITPLPLGEGKGEGPLTHRGPSAYREHRGLTPSPSPNGEGSSMRGYPYWATQNWRICRGISVNTPLSIRRGAGGEASEGCWVLDVGC